MATLNASAAVQISPLASHPSSSSSSLPVIGSAVQDAEAECRLQLGLGKLEEALKVAAQCAALEVDGLGDWNDKTWEESVKLKPLLALALQSDFAPPPQFQPTMETCMACLLHAPPGHLLQPERMVRLLESADWSGLQRYLVWLEEALKDVSLPASGSQPGGGGAEFCRTVLVPQRVRSALASWPAEQALLLQSALALAEALVTHGPTHHKSYHSWRTALEERKEIQSQQSQDCQRVASEFEGAVAFFVDQVQDSSSAEWPQIARVTQVSLERIQQIAADLLQSQQECWSQALEDYEALGSKVSACRAAVSEARRQVRRHEQAFRQAAQRFTEVAQQLVAWTSVLVPSLRRLETLRVELRKALELRRTLPALEREHLAAEDELDTAQTELRKHKRHAQASALGRSRPVAASASSDAAAAAIVLERQYELRISNAQKRASMLSEQIRDAERRLRELEAALPVVLDFGDEGEASAEPRAGRDSLSNEERLALKLATLQQFHEEMVVEVAETQVERDKILRKVEKRKVEAALRRHVEPDFMCPILHERMRVPVLAADGFTYERQAIEKWLSMHNTSPMTGALLAHRYLTENFALRHLMDAYDEKLASEKRLSGGKEGQVSRGKSLGRKGHDLEDVGELEPLEDEADEDGDEEEEEDWDDSDEEDEDLPVDVTFEEDMPILSRQLDDG